VLPLLFFLAVAMLFPFAVGPDARLLGRTGAGVIWVAALLAAILPLDRLVEPDLEAGFFDQWALRGIAEEALLLVRIIAHWISFGCRCCSPRRFPPGCFRSMPGSCAWSNWGCCWARRGWPRSA
jgi:heme exporter protein B